MVFLKIIGIIFILLFTLGLVLFLYEIKKAPIFPDDL